MKQALDSRGARVFARPFGLVVMTRVAGANDETFRKAAVAWLATDEGRGWLAVERAEGRS